MKYCRPPEWYNDKTICLAWPYAAHLWQSDLPKAQEEFVLLIKALKDEKIIILVPNDEEETNLLKSLGLACEVKIIKMPYGDIWLRDTLPIMVKDEGKRDIAVIPHFNGWGNKYLFRDDKTLAKRFSEAFSLINLYSPLVMEGGAIECDGQGTLLTTESCLLNKNRNSGLKKHEVEYELNRLFGAKKVIWLRGALLNDHTDGHIDTLARFIGPHKVAIMMPESPLDPNYQVLMDIKEELSKQSDALGNKFDLVELPSPGIIKNADGDILAASYLNFIIGSHVVVVPIYGAKQDDEAIDNLQKHFSLPVVGVNANSILTGGGAFHCMSQEIWG